MKYSIFKIGFLAISILAFFSCNQKMMTNNYKAKQPKINLNGKTLSGISVMSFGPDNVLFLGDSKAGMIYALPTIATALKEPIPYNLMGVNNIIAKALGVASDQIIINDMQIHPVSQEAYIAIKNGHAPDAKSMIAVVNPTDKAVRFLDLSQATNQQVSIKDKHTENFTFYNKSSNVLNITDIDYYDGYIYVAGITNGEFASTLRKIKYPFNGEQTRVAGIEMYHAVHAQKETRAPIRAMTFETIDGNPTLIASYTCTPLVSIPADEIKEGNHINAKTIAELGYGNTPIDMITFMAQEQDGSYDKKLLITHKSRSASLISLKDFAKANQGGGLDHFSMGPEGVQIFPVPMASVMQLSDQNQAMLAMLRRNMDNGDIDLVSMFKGAYFRISDFKSEFEFPDYKYPEGYFWRDFQNGMKQMEGYPELRR